MPASRRGELLQGSTCPLAFRPCWSSGRVRRRWTAVSRSWCCGCA